jgi:hypothetical protein
MWGSLTYVRISDVKVLHRPFWPILTLFTRLAPDEIGSNPGCFHLVLMSIGVNVTIHIHEILSQRRGIPRFWSPKLGPEIRAKLQYKVFAACSGKAVFWSQKLRMTGNDMVWSPKGWHSASILIIICNRQKPIKVSHRTFILLNIWWLLANFAVSLPFP